VSSTTGLAFGHSLPPLNSISVRRARKAETDLIPKPDTKVAGYLAYLSPAEVVCMDVDACVILGSIGAMRQYLAEMDPLGAPRATVKKTRFGEIWRGLELGAAYAFDQEAYAKFYPLALQAGLPVAAADFEKAGDRGLRFFTVRLRGGDW